MSVICIVFYEKESVAISINTHALLNRELAASFIPILFKITCLGEDVQLSVQIEGEPEVNWYKDGTVLEDQGRYVIVDQIEDQVFTFAIEDVLPEDEGEYRCAAENEAGKSETIARLFVSDHEYPPEFTNEGQDEPYVVKEGEDLKFDVSVKGKPFPKVTWFKNDRSLQNTSHFDISENGREFSLGIRNVTLDDRGVYKCEATSKLGKATRKFQVNLEGMLFHSLW